MSRYKMHAIEYNVYMTLLKLLSDKMPDILKAYNLHDDIHIEPAYPRDITNMFKPSIIMRRVDTVQYKVGFGNALGQIFDQGILKDVDGVGHEFLVQFDTVCNGNIQNLMIVSMLKEDLFNDTMINSAGKIQLYDFTGNEKNPTEMGVLKMMDFPQIVHFQYDDLARPTLNNDYKSVIRVTFTVIQEVLPKQEYVDLSKWIKIHQTIKIKEVKSNG